MYAHSLDAFDCESYAFFVVTDQIDGSETEDVVAVDVKTGEVVWTLNKGRKKDGAYPPTAWAEAEAEGLRFDRDKTSDQIQVCVDQKALRTDAHKSEQDVDMPRTGAQRTPRIGDR